MIKYYLPFMVLVDIVLLLVSADRYATEGHWSDLLIAFVFVGFLVFDIKSLVDKIEKS